MMERIMARNETIDCPAGAPTLLTNGDVAALRVTNVGVAPAHLVATVGTTPPVSRGAFVPLAAGETLAADLALADLWPSLIGVNRVWCWPDSAALLAVNHA
jgi:hypothetical protein